MKPSLYLDKSKKVIVKINGTGPDGKGIQLESEAKVLKRPLLDRLLSVCNKEEGGEVEFSDRACFTGTAIKVDNLELWYSGVLVGERMIPDVILSAADTLEVTWRLTIDCHGRPLGAMLFI